MAKTPRRSQAKTQRRKQVLAERRKQAAALPAPSSAAGLLRRGLSCPIRSCLLQEGLFQRGNGMLLLARRLPSGSLILAGFLLDTFCLGVKDAFLREVEPDDLDHLVEHFAADSGFSEVDLSYARKLLRDSAAYGRSLGFVLPRAYAVAEQLFGDADAAACDVDFTFGQDGKPHYITGPQDTPARIRQRIKQLERSVGNGNFHVTELLPEDAEDWDGEYNPYVGPDADDWRDMDDAERRQQVLAFHRQEGSELPNEDLHAMIHVVIENQVAMGDQIPVKRTLERLVGEGLDRHDAIHAISAILIEELAQSAEEPDGKGESEVAYFARLETLTAESWLRWLEEEKDDEE